MTRRLSLAEASKILDDGFPVAARHAWGAAVPSDPPFAAWLAQIDLSGHPRNGLNFLAPKLLRQGQMRKALGSRAGLLRGLVRYRLASNAAKSKRLGDLTSALTEAGMVVTISGGWSDVIAGDLPLQDATLCHSELAITPFDEAAVAEILSALGCRPHRRFWWLPLSAEEPEKDRILVTVGPRLQLHARAKAAREPMDGASRLVHLPLPDRILAIAANLAGAPYAPDLKRRALDRLESLFGILSSTEGISALRLRARQLQLDGELDRALGLLDCIRTDGIVVPMLGKASNFLKVPQLSRAWSGLRIGLR